MVFELSLISSAFGRVCFCRTTPAPWAGAPFYYKYPPFERVCLRSKGLSHDLIYILLYILNLKIQNDGIVIGVLKFLVDMLAIQYFDPRRGEETVDRCDE